MNNLKQAIVSIVAACAIFVTFVSHAEVTKTDLEINIERNLPAIAKDAQKCKLLLSIPRVGYIEKAIGYVVSIFTEADKDLRALTDQEIDAYKYTNSDLRQAACALCGDFFKKNRNKAYEAICDSLKIRLPQPILNAIASKLRASTNDACKSFAKAGYGLAALGAINKRIIAAHCIDWFANEQHPRPHALWALLPDSERKTLNSTEEQLNEAEEELSLPTAQRDPKKVAWAKAETARIEARFEKLKAPKGKNK